MLLNWGFYCQTKQEEEFFFPTWIKFYIWIEDYIFYTILIMLRIYEWCAFISFKKSIII